MVSVVGIVKFALAVQVFFGDVYMIYTITSDTCRFCYQLLKSICFQGGSHHIVFLFEVIKVKVPGNHSGPIQIDEVLENFEKFLVICLCLVILRLVHCYHIKGIELELEALCEWFIDCCCRNEVFPKSFLDKNCQPSSTALPDCWGHNAAITLDCWKG